MSARCNTRTAGASDARWATRFCNALLQQGFHHAEATGGKSKTHLDCTGLRVLLVLREVCRARDWRLKVRHAKELAIDLQDGGEVGVVRDEGFLLKRSKKDSSQVLCKPAVTTHPRTFGRRRRKAGIIIIMLQRAWKSGSSGADRVLAVGRREFRDHTAVGEPIFIANHASSTITCVDMLASLVRHAQQIQLQGANMHAHVVPVYTQQQESRDRSFRRIGRTSCTLCLLPCRSP
jgi:hypothetical protein